METIGYILRETMKEDGTQIASQMPHGEHRSLAETIGTVSDVQAPQYRPLLDQGETLRIFNPGHISQLLEAISGEKGKMLRLAAESLQDYSSPERRQLNEKIIKTYFLTQLETQLARFLPPLNKDGSNASPSNLAIPVAISKAAKPLKT